MADKLNEFAGKFGKGGAPKGLGIGIKLLAVAAAGAYGLKESMYTGKRSSTNDVTILLSNYFLHLKNPFTLDIIIKRP